MSNLYKTIVPGSTIGIIGGGQLGRMMALSAREMGYRIAVLDPTPDSPCGQVADVEITAAYHDINAIQKLASVSDVITYEFENIDHDALTWLHEHTYLPQGTELLRITQDRETEKTSIQTLGVPVAPFQIVTEEAELDQAVQSIGIPCVVKTCRGGYDGKGQQVIRNTEDVKAAYPLLQAGKCIVEGWVPFEKELSVIISRNPNGETKTLPLAENIHVDNILHQTIVPARVNQEVVEQAYSVAKIIADGLGLIGTLAVEMFLVGDEIFVNELAPRPHNSGHYSIEGCVTSQFEQHIRAVCNLPLGDTTLLTPTVMVNLLGEHVEPTLEQYELILSGKVHLYGKKEAKLKRKMGHITFLGEDVEEILQDLSKLTIWNEKAEVKG
ncbi:5-(carboxyamino)imidazole ribonucleotide synthase [Bacillus pinisoli]|uniref:5-(carboxyamino)imidazole ribonucleotide synthase n=1 Tax=Bacillus pinisoli TaxID=2901866 RepID=UPI001FF4CBC5